MAKIRRIKIKPNRGRQIPGNSPGIIELSDDARKPRITLYSYNQDEYIKTERNSGFPRVIA